MCGEICAPMEAAAGERSQELISKASREILRQD